MKLHLARYGAHYAFSGYGKDYVEINGARRNTSVIVLPQEIRDWNPTRFEDLDDAALAQLAQLPVEVVLLGTGKLCRFPSLTIAKTLRERGIGLEIMDTRAACRTYNILLAEERRVGAALLIGAD